MIASEGHQRDERPHANAERDDADQRERSLLGERPYGVSQVACDRNGAHPERSTGGKRWCIESVRDPPVINFTLQITLCKRRTSGRVRLNTKELAGWFETQLIVDEPQWRASMTATITFTSSSRIDRFDDVIQNPAASARSRSDARAYAVRATAGSAANPGFARMRRRSV